MIDDSDDGYLLPARGPYGHDGDYSAAKHSPSAKQQPPPPPPTLPPVPRWFETSGGTRIEGPHRHGMHGMAIDIRKHVGVQDQSTGNQYLETIAVRADPIAPEIGVHFVQFIWQAAWAEFRRGGGEPGWLNALSYPPRGRRPRSGHEWPLTTPHGRPSPDGITASHPRWDLDVFDGATVPFYDKIGVSVMTWHGTGPAAASSLTVYDAPSGRDGYLRDEISRRSVIRALQVFSQIEQYLVLRGDDGHWDAFARARYQTRTAVTNTGRAIHTNETAEQYGEYLEFSSAIVDSYTVVQPSIVPVTTIPSELMDVLRARGYSL